MSNWNFEKPLVTNITNLTAFATTNQVTIDWIYPTDFTDISTHDPSNLIEYKLYRHIEILTPVISANGGPFVEPMGYYTPFFTTNSQPEPIFKLIATLPATTTTYTDTFNDLNIHTNEGIRFINNRWVDTDGNDILNDISTSRRRLFYKLIGISKKMVFNKLPFLYLCHTDGIECKSTITQVKWNTLYYEGDTVWFNNAITNCNRTTVDIVYDVQNSRYLNVWVSGSGNQVYCLDGRNGQLITSFTLPFSNIFGLRVDPSTGDGIIIGSNRNIYRCVLSTGATISIVDINTNFSPNGNNGLVLTKETNQYYASVIANMDVVTKSGITQTATEIVPRTTFGCSSATIANVPNILGITNGPDTGVWVNGHIPIHYKYSATRTNQQRTGRWSDNCEHLRRQYKHWYRARYGQNPPTEYQCSDKDYTIQTSVSTVVVNSDVNFLQDIGYVYGATAGVNQGLSNGESYPYPNGTYKPFTSKSFRTGWFGQSYSAGGDLFGRPYTTGSTVNPETNPNPGLSQKGLAATIPSTGILSANNYDLYQVNEFENKIHKLTWNGTALTYNYIDESNIGILNTDYWNITKPVHITIDSQNNIWSIQENLANPELTVLYQNVSTEDFPNGGLARWPKCSTVNGRFGVATSYLYGSPYNDPYIEYYLTRNISFTPSITTTPTDGYRNGFGIQLTGDLGEQRTTARTWCLIDSNLDTIGKRIFTFYTTPSSTHAFARYGGDTTEYNSDNTGLSYIFTEQQTETYPEIVKLNETSPQIDLKISTIDSTPVNCDGNFWNNQKTTSTTSTSVSGYDHLQVQLSATLISLGSYPFNGYDFYYADKAIDNDGSANPVKTTTTNNTVTYTYHDPSLNGKPSNRTNAVTNGMYNPYVRLNLTTNAYYVTGDNVTNNSAIGTVVVWERWPTARFFITPFDVPTIRQTYLSSWNLTSYNCNVGNNGYDVNSDSQIISGYDPLSAQFTDTSISRTQPISAWYWTFGDKLEYGGFPLNNSVIGISTPHVISQSLTGNSTKDTCLSNQPNMVSHVYKGPGTYYATLWVKASNTETTSWPISADSIDQVAMAQSFTVAVSREIKVLEVCPNLLFDVITGQTLPATYTNDLPLTSFPHLSADRRYDGIWSSYGLISGYAPYVHVTVNGSATARSLPFSALQWDWSDPFTDLAIGDTTRYVYPTAGWPNWNNSSYTVTGEHTFIMPGFYNISLVPIVSSPQIGYISNCSSLQKQMHVYVTELFPQASFTSNMLSGNSPVTITFNPSSTSAGSFPICRLEWDFGDGSTTTISRMLSTNYTNYTNSGVYADPSDPRNILIAHCFNRTNASLSANYLVTLSAFACNTNSANVITMNIGPIAQINSTNVEGDIHLIENRMFNSTNDVLLVFEGQNSKSNFTVLLSSENL